MSEAPTTRRAASTKRPVSPASSWRSQGIIDEETANVVEDFWVADETLDTASQILCNPEPNVTRMMMMCSPVRDWPGGTGWHRDIHPVDMAPLDRVDGGHLGERAEIHAVERALVR